MRVNRLHETLQWFALLGGALAWAVQFVLAFWIAASRCSPANGGWRVPEEPYYMVITAPTALVCLLALGSAVWLYLRLRHAGNEPPAGRHVFFAYASIMANTLFLALTLLGGIGVLYHLSCTQA